MTRTNLLFSSLAIALLSLIAAPRAFAQPLDWERPPELPPPPAATATDLTLRLGLGVTAAGDIGGVADLQVIAWPHFDGVPGLGIGGRAYASAYFELFSSNGTDGAAQVQLSYRTGGETVWAYAHVGAGFGGYDEHGDNCGLQLFSETEDCDHWHRGGTGISTSAGTVLVFEIESFNFSLGASVDGILPDHVRGNFTLGLGGTFDLR
jgi:hypothetical protein